MFNHSVTRYWAGILLNGGQLDLRLIPNEYGKINVDVTVQSSITGFDRAIRLTSDEPTSFHQDEILIDDNAITCMAASETLSAFREGFICPLEPGMAPMLREWLPRLGSVARISASIRSAAHDQLMTMEPPVYISQLYAAFPLIASNILLDGFDTNAAIKILRVDRLYGGEPALLTVLTSDSVRLLLDEAEQLASAVTADLRAICGTGVLARNGNGPLANWCENNPESLGKMASYGMQILAIPNTE